MRKTKKFYALMFKHSTGWVPYVVEPYKTSAEKQMKSEMDKSPSDDFIVNGKVIGVIK